MAIFEMVMPRMGESIMECTVLAVLKNVGDHVEADEPILEVATDKVDTEVPAAVSGIVKEILVKAGDVVAIDSVIVRIETNQTASNGQAQTNKVVETIRESEIAIPFVETVLERQPVLEKLQIVGTRFYSPLVQTIAKAEGITMAELEQIAGTGAEGRVTKTDLLKYISQLSVKEESNQTLSPAQSKITQPLSQIPLSPSAKPHSVQMDRMRKMIAERMVESRRISAHVTSFVECDMTKVVNWRNSAKDKFKQETGESLTFTPILIQAVVKAIQDFRAINVSLEGDMIVNKPDINIGMAVALPSGNLIVPVIHQADKYTLTQLSAKVNDLANRARTNKLTADDLAGGTYTISNIGTFGNIMGTPIIVQPQVAIMAFGAIQKKPVVIETSQGDSIGIRSMMYLSHSYDHRIVDGALGGLFVKRVADYLEQFEAL
jgi:2-oxoglutarate dehydrogenase E2 component (dihydrolipoamide succinyltransferase)